MREHVACFLVQIRAYRFDFRAARGVVVSSTPTHSLAQRGNSSREQPIMAEYRGEYGHPYPRVDQYGNPVPPVDQYGNPVPRGAEVDSAGGTATAYGDSDTAGHMASSTPHPAVSPGDYGGNDAVIYGLGGAEHPLEGVVSGAVAPGGAAYPPGGGDVPSGVTAPYAYEGMVGSDGGGAAAAAQLQPTIPREHTTTLGEKMRHSGSSSSSSSAEDVVEGQGGRRKKSIKQKIKEKLPGGHKQQEEHKAGHAVPAAETGTHAAGMHEKKGIVEKIKEKLPCHH
ncbi:hypothetical protein GUJ93_ZPchr0001g30898 [Zizania palustris]|uniref:Dehydrin n=1 Tax=Zizania palustris TaxID=103762 RepID=A0A8J5VDN3_ZIZPA|nr:hypothetical protein GUJ93_ZPchr0001g30898 [Zizania palustris]